MGMDCSHVVTGNTVQEVKQKALKHAQEAHADVLQNATPQQMDEMDKLMESKIR